jgi:rare lipoprotein A
MRTRGRVLLSSVKGAATVAVAWSAAAALSVASMLAVAGTDTPQPGGSPGESIQAPPPRATAPLDRSGKTQRGKASFYANRYAGRPMADGSPMRLYSNNAASLTLPLGTTARVTNLHTGMSAVVTIEDRGPYVRGRIIDLSPATARKIGLARKQGIAPVEVTPLTVPLADGTVKVLVDERGATAGDRSS